jgi:para-nitrobenzyl esterase
VWTPTFKATSRRVTPFRPCYPATDIEESALTAARDGFYGWSAQRLARAQTRLGQPAYLYFFDHRYPAAVEGGLAGFHGSELSYEFGVVGSGSLPRDWPAPSADGGERSLSQMAMNCFTSFARGGTPALPDGPVWEPYDAFLEIRDGPPVEGSPFWGRSSCTRRSLRAGVPREYRAGTSTWGLPPRSRRRLQPHPPSRLMRQVTSATAQPTAA